MAARNPIKDQLRKHLRTRRLGKHAACARCGITTPETLILVKRSLLEEHHVVGKAHDSDLTVPLCRNCHAIATEAARDAGASMRPAAGSMERLAMALPALGSFFAILGKRLIAWGEELAEQIEARDDQ